MPILDSDIRMSFVHALSTPSQFKCDRIRKNERGKRKHQPKMNNCTRDCFSKDHSLPADLECSCVFLFMPSHGISDKLSMPGAGRVLTTSARLEDPIITCPSIKRLSKTGRVRLCEEIRRSMTTSISRGGIFMSSREI